MESDLIFPVDVDPETVLGISMEGTIRTEPQCTITPSMERLLGGICELVGRLYVPTAGEQDLRLRRINRIRTIRGSSAIEGNTLSEEQITAILEGKWVVAPPREIQ